MTGSGATVTGSALRSALVVPHTTTGALVGQGSTIAGTARRFRAHPTTGALTGQGSIVSGVARRFRTHTTTGALVGPNAVVNGVATRFRAFDATGDLVGQGSVVVGSAALVKLYPDPAYVLSGVVYGPGGIYTGTLVPSGATGVVFDVATGNLVQVLSSTLVLSLI